MLVVEEQLYEHNIVMGCKMGKSVFYKNFCGSTPSCVHIFWYKIFLKNCYQVNGIKGKSIC